jgi:hypothetical protein
VCGLTASAPAMIVALSTVAAASPKPSAVTAYAGTLYGVSAVSADDAWAVGSTGGNSAAILHWKGATWGKVAVPDAKGGDLAAVSAPAANDAWAVGSAHTGTTNLALHWNGTTWASVTVPNPGGSDTIDQLTGVSALSPDDVWAVGTEHSAHTGDFNAMILQWNGTAWSQSSLPALGNNAGLNAVDALSPDDVWAVGDTGSALLALHWNGTSWRQAKIGTLTGCTAVAASGSLDAVSALSRTDAWATGSCMDPTTGAQFSLAMRWNGTNWTQTTTPSPGGTTDTSLTYLPGVSALSATDAWAVGYYGNNASGFVAQTMVLHWDGTSWTQVTSPSVGTSSVLEAIAAVSPTQLWAVGGTSPFTPTGKTLVLSGNGSAWTRS